MKESDLKTLLRRKGRQTIDLLRYSNIDNNDLETKFKFLADTVEKAKLQKRKMTGGHKDARVPSKKARYGYEDLGDSSSETETQIMTQVRHLQRSFDFYNLFNLMITYQNPSQNQCFPIFFLLKK